MAISFATWPGFGIDWTCVAIGAERELHEIVSTVPAEHRGTMCALPKRPKDSNWALLAQALQKYPEWETIDAVIPNGVLAGWALPAVLWRETGRRPAVIGSIHNDMDIAYQMSGEGVSHCDGVFAVSRHCQDEFVRRYPSLPKPAFIPYCVPIAERISARASNGPLQLVYCGRVTQPQKRVLDLVPLVSALVARKTDFVLHVVGDGPDLPSLRRQIDTSGCHDRVVVHGPIPTAQVPSLMATMDVLVSVSEYEGTSISMLEAMGQGVVPVVTDIASGVRDVIQPGVNGWVVPIGATTAMADVIFQLSRNREQLAMASAGAWERVKSDYSFYASAQSMGEFLHVSAQHPRGGYRMYKNHPIWRAAGRLESPWLPNWVVRSLRSLRLTTSRQRPL
jgi:glycosyltransferase involved in cell wall biosynthesis